MLICRQTICNRRTRLTRQGGGLPLSCTSTCFRPATPTARVDGHLSLFLNSWDSITRDKYVLHHLQHGLRISFHIQPLLTSSPVPFPLQEASSKKEQLRCGILPILEKGTTERVANKFSPGFYSLLLVIPKTYG